MSEEQELSPHHRADVIVTQDGTSVTLKTPAGGVTLTVNQAQAVAARLIDAAAVANDEEPEENENARIPMQYIHVSAERLEYEVEGSESSALPTDEEMGDAKWAEVHCWIRDQTARNAMHVVTGNIAEHGWVVTEVFEQIPVMRDDFTETEYLPYYEQALLDSEVFLYEIEDETEELGSSDNVS